jgi:hypothetical protein
LQANAQAFPGICKTEKLKMVQVRMYPCAIISATINLTMTDYLSSWVLAPKKLNINAYAHVAMF